uniref:GYF domain-containing protein n=2 Tax=Eukaryota TaxID=2759 RepID=A0A7S1X760_9CHLO|mmetsp:Transcript_39107/g.70034  ORF Transcript_39107/g.70034 Transcript_39107/m.70034 type:complete len:159 (+) Transcript_39107:133-609(+)|eukprot:CAMPEP_0177751856 /NCGR_PEP_ID=MMETSP0491_2-20121128/607_1 /TAXON_ID=63592 /ORGANISM="Tetraselmis chuii, Strain PLY429" /LENGTH=158 /DNA_ID=CAMNT_0019267017 /DNA_START=129 /DNA_END=605 /DNA_ORIENTATION=-
MVDEKPVRLAQFATEGGPRITPRRTPGQPGYLRGGADGSITFEQRQQFDYIRTATKKNVWYYRDRLNTARGPCTLPVLREAWVQGIIDEHTLVWGQGLADWLPARNVRTLVPQIRTLEVQAATFIKKQFVLKPALEKIRKERAAFRTSHQTWQVDNMF